MHVWQVLRHQSVEVENQSRDNVVVGGDLLTQQILCAVNVSLTQLMYELQITGESASIKQIKKERKRTSRICCTIGDDA